MILLAAALILVLVGVSVAAIWIHVAFQRDLRASVARVERRKIAETPTAPLSIAASQAEAHAGLLDALGIARTAIRGASAGTPSAMQFAIKYPKRCVGLVLPPEMPGTTPEFSPVAKLCWARCRRSSKQAAR
jgi:hypothetical protein